MNNINTTGHIGNLIHELEQLNKQTNQMGFDTELHDIFDDTTTLYENVNKLMQDCKDKQFELNIIETLAWDSTDPSIASLREQLMVAVKLIHADDIEQVKKINSGNNIDAGLSFSYTTNPTEDTTYSSFSVMIKNPYDIYHNAIAYLEKRKQYRTLLKDVKKELKNFIGLK